MIYPVLDERDMEIAVQRFQALAQLRRPRVGDHVDFADGVQRRISHLWHLADRFDVQTSTGGSWYVGLGYVSFSGGLYVSVPGESLVLTDEWRSGDVWMFHHNLACAGNGIALQLPFRVYACSVPAPRY